MKLLEVHNFSVSFKIDKKTTFQAVKEISFTLNSGDILGLIGESGSGKSVASQSITRLLHDAEVNGSAMYTYGEKSINLTDCDIEILQKMNLPLP